MTSTVRLTQWSDVKDAFRRRQLRQALYDAGGAVMSDCLLNLHGTAHRDRRRIENRLFRRTTFEHWEYQVLAPTIAETLKPYVAAGSGDLVVIGYRLAMNLTATVAGLDLDPGDAARSNALLDIVAKLSEGATAVHSTRDVDALNAEVGQALERLDEEFMAPAIEARTGDGHAAAAESDVLATLLHHREKLDLSHESLRREIGFYLQAGAHSTAHTLVHSFEHWWSWASDTNRNPFDFDLELLQRVVYESLRLHPASPVALRRAVEPLALSNGVEVAVGDEVVLDLLAANRDPDVFGPDADAFNPDRVPAQGAPLWGHSFGGGPHSCIGRELDGGVPAHERLANDGSAPLYGTVAVMLAALLDHRFEPNADDPPEPLANSTRPHHGRFPVRLRKQGQ